MQKRRFVITNNGVEMGSTNNKRDALRLCAQVKGDIDDNRPEPKFRWLKDDILEAKH